MNQQLIAKNWRDLIRPRMLELEDRSENYGKFACEPLERGFGITLGNSLRRILLSSLQGAAITAIKIEGALHEFTHLPDVVEDVTDIILNLKEVVVRMQDHKPRIVRLDTSINKVNAEASPVLFDEKTLLFSSLRTETVEYNYADSTTSPGRRLHFARNVNGKWKYGYGAVD